MHTYVYKYICMYKFGPGVDSGSQPLSANKNKRINPSTAHLLITKPHAQSPLHAHPRKKKLLFSLSGKNKNATLPPFNSTTPCLLFTL